MSRIPDTAFFSSFNRHLRGLGFESRLLRFDSRPVFQGEKAGHSWGTTRGDCLAGNRRQNKGYGVQLLS